MFMFCSDQALMTAHANIYFIRAEIGHMRVQIGRQRRDPRELQEAAIARASAEALLKRTVARIESFRIERDRLRREEKPSGPTYITCKRIHGTPPVAGRNNQSILSRERFLT